MTISDPSGLFPVDEEGKPIPFWRQKELEVGGKLRAEYPADRYTILYNRAVRDPDTGQALRDAGGSVRRPDFQVIENATGDVVNITEVGTGSTEYLTGQKIPAFQRYQGIAGQLEPQPTVRLEYEVTPSPVFGLAGRIFYPLMIIDMLIFSAEFMMQSEPRTVKS